MFSGARVVPLHCDNIAKSVLAIAAAPFVIRNPLAFKLSCSGF